MNISDEILVTMDRISSFIPNHEDVDDRRMSRQSHSGQDVMMVVEEVRAKCELEKKSAVTSMMNFMKRKCQREILSYKKKKEAETAKVLEEEKKIRNNLQRKVTDWKLCRYSEISCFSLQAIKPTKLIVFAVHLPPQI